MNKLHYLTNNKSSVVIKQKKYIDEDLGTLVDIVISDGLNVKTVENAFINLDFDLLVNKSFKNEFIKIISDFDRYDRVLKMRNANFGAFVYEDNNFKKYTYDKSGERTKKYLDDNKIIPKNEEYNLLEDKVIYKYEDKSFFSSIPLIENDNYFVGINYIELDKNKLIKEQETGDIVDIYVVDGDSKITKYENFFISLDKVLLFIDEDYRNFVANVVSDHERNIKALKNKNAYLGIITKEDKPIKMTNSYAAENIKLNYYKLKSNIIDYKEKVIE